MEVPLTAVQLYLRDDFWSILTQCVQYIQGTVHHVMTVHHNSRTIYHNINCRTRLGIINNFNLMWMYTGNWKYEDWPGFNKQKPYHTIHTNSYRCKCRKKNVEWSLVTMAWHVLWLWKRMRWVGHITCIEDE